MIPPLYIYSGGVTTTGNADAANSKMAGALICPEPDLGAWLEPKNTRRMAHISRMAFFAALTALANREQKPVAVIVGTGFGSLADTGVFLQKMIEQGEEFLTPTAFIQSTHNTVAGQLGLYLECHGVNQTITQGGFSMEHAMIDAALRFDNGMRGEAIVGGVDELTPFSYDIQQRVYEAFPAARQPYPLAEGAAFFVTGTEQKEGAIRIMDIKCVGVAASPDQPGIEIMKMLLEHQLAFTDIDLFYSGASRENCPLALLSGGEEKVVYFKDVCGNYPTATGYALYLAMKELQSMPAESIALIYNKYRHNYHSFILLSC